MTDCRIADLGFVWPCMKGCRWKRGTPIEKHCIWFTKWKYVVMDMRSKKMVKASKLIAMQIDRWERRQAKKVIGGFPRIHINSDAKGRLGPP